MAGGKLTALKLRALTTAGRYGDGGGLWLQVRDAERRSWLFRYTSGGRQRQMGLGPFPDVSLAEAREAAGRCRAAVRQGADPIEQRRQARRAAAGAAGGATFRQVADRYLAVHETAWRNPKHRYQWRATLDLACSQIGGLPIAAVATADVLRVLEPIWSTKTETATRLRGRIESVLDFASARGWRTGPNPAQWRGHLAKLLPPPDKIHRVQHHAALPWRDMATFMAALRAAEGVAARALELTILTAARTSETINAQWSEFDLQDGTWTVPAERMKAGREHRVPLTDAALIVLQAVAPLGNATGDGLVFPGGRPGKPLSNMAMSMLLRRMGYAALTVHGFRSTFRDWAAEATNHPREVAEAALAHILADKVEAAYRRGDLFEKRRALMSDWAAWCGAGSSLSDVAC